MDKIDFVRIMVFVGIAGTLLFVVLPTALAQISRDVTRPEELPDEKNDNAITVDNSDRREYVYCPIDTEELKVITTYEINGCPLVRVYIDNWTKLTLEEQTIIGQQMKANGFKDVGAVDRELRGH